MAERDDLALGTAIRKVPDRFGFSTALGAAVRHVLEDQGYAVVPVEPQAIKEWLMDRGLLEIEDTGPGFVLAWQEDGSHD